MPRLRQSIISTFFSLITVTNIFSLLFAVRVSCLFVFAVNEALLLHLNASMATRGHQKAWKVSVAVNHVLELPDALVFIALYSRLVQGGIGL